MARRRFRPDANLGRISSDQDQRRARAIQAGNLAAVYDRLYDRLPEHEREQTLKPLRALILTGAVGQGRGARRWVTRYQQDLIDYNRYVVIRTLLRIGVTWTEISDRAEQHLGVCGRSVIASYTRVGKALRRGDDGRYYFSRRLVVASDEHRDGLYALPDPDLLNAIPRL